MSQGISEHWRLLYLLRETPNTLDFVVVHQRKFSILSVIMSPRAYRDDFLIMALGLGIKSLSI